MTALAFLRNEAAALLSRLHQLRPFALTMPMTLASSADFYAINLIDKHLAGVKTGLSTLVHRYLKWLEAAETRGEDPQLAQASFAMLKLRFNQILDQTDIFADVFAQRAEHETGAWIAGMDTLARDALQLQLDLYTAPEILCFLNRGHGAAIRRARTRLPGGDLNPVAVIQVPRERMVGSGIGASLIHEVGHQAVALLDIMPGIRSRLREAAAVDARHQKAWGLYDRWISEILADVWSMGHLGIGASMGLISVVSLPKYFVFRMLEDDPHPFPWIRVKLSLAFGRLFYPDEQWEMLEETWNTMYPTLGLPPEKARLIRHLEATMPQFVRLVANFRAETMQNNRFMDILPWRERRPDFLRRCYENWRRQPELWLHQKPSLVFAAVGQAKWDKKIDSRFESALLVRCLTEWALQKKTHGPPPAPVEAGVSFLIHQ